jgi:hypothetical protein
MILLAALAMAAAPATDEVLDLSKPEAVVAAVQAAGYKAEIKKDDDGAPYIVSAANGQPFTLNLYGCEKGACDSLNIESWYKPEPIFTTTLTNEWNNNNRYLTITIDKEGKLRERAYVSLVGKLTRKNFVDQIEWYISQDGRFAKFLDEKRPTAKK